MFIGPGPGLFLRKRKMQPDKKILFTAFYEVNYADRKEA